MYNKRNLYKTKLANESLTLPRESLKVFHEFEKLANLNPSKGTEPGKLRLVVIAQTDLLNDIHPTVVICTGTTRVRPDAEILRVHLSTGQLDQPSEIMVNQIRAIDKRRLIKKIGKLKKDQVKQLKRNVGILLE